MPEIIRFFVPAGSAGYLKCCLCPLYDSLASIFLVVTIIPMGFLISRDEKPALSSPFITVALIFLGCEYIALLFYLFGVLNAAVGTALF